MTQIRCAECGMTGYRDDLYRLPVTWFMVKFKIGFTTTTELRDARCIPADRRFIVLA